MRLTLITQKICHVTSSHRPDDPRILLKELASLATSYPEIYLVSHNFKEIIPPAPNIILITTGKAIYSNRYLRLTFGAWQIFRTAIKVNASYYHIHDPELLIFLPLFKLCRKIFIYDAHEDLAKIISRKAWIPAKIKPLAKKLVNFVEKSLCRLCNAVVTVCDEMNPLFEKYCKRVVSIYNAPKLTDFPLDKNTEKKMQLCYVGNMDTSKNVKTMIQAAYQAKIKLALVGAFEKKTLQECQALEAWHCVEYFNYLSHPKAVKVMMQSIAGLVLFKQSQYYHPTKLYEYMAAGIPIIATNFPEWIERVEEKGIGICVNPDNIDEIVAAIKYFSVNPQNAIAMGKKARQCAEIDYSWEVQERKLLSLYKSLSNDAP